jgi:hypothetical protein
MVELKKHCFFNPRADRINASAAQHIARAKKRRAVVTEIKETERSYLTKLEQLLQVCFGIASCNWRTCTGVHCNDDVSIATSAGL